ncbi:hypothetical protein ATO13_08231 [Stappia sp. 22II-S9-Z10]|nr:hypothetical protein ATO13_08231 [Stappia sp. 22II-S9-Z10]
MGCGQWLETFIDVHVWSETVGMPQAMRIMAAVRSALHSADLDFDSEGDPVGAVQSFQHQSSRVMRGRDPKVTHGIITFRAFLSGEY